MSEIDSKNVDFNVDGKPAASKKPKYVKGKFPFTVLNTETDTLYVRKTVTINKTVFDPKTGKEKFIKQQQIWRVCADKTRKCVDEVLNDLNEEIELLKTGRPKALAAFNQIAKKFEDVELTAAVFRGEKKVSGKINTQTPKIYLRYLIEYFGNQDISTITYPQIQKYKADRLAAPVKREVKKKTFIPREKRPAGSRKRILTEKLVRETPRSIRSVNYELTILKQVFNFAMRNRWLTHNPFADVKTPNIEPSA